MFSGKYGSNTNEQFYGLTDKYIRMSRTSRFKKFIFILIRRSNWCQFFILYCTKFFGAKNKKNYNTSPQYLHAHSHKIISKYVIIISICFIGAYPTVYLQN